MNEVITFVHTLFVFATSLSKSGKGSVIKLRTERGNPIDEVVFIYDRDPRSAERIPRGTRITGMTATYLVVDGKPISPRTMESGTIFHHMRAHGEGQVSTPARHSTADLWLGPEKKDDDDDSAAVKS